MIYSEKHRGIINKYIVVGGITYISLHYEYNRWAWYTVVLRCLIQHERYACNHATVALYISTSN